jgi:hypothetical protein
LFFSNFQLGSLRFLNALGLVSQLLLEVADGNAGIFRSFADGNFTEFGSPALKTLGDFSGDSLLSGLEFRSPSSQQVFAFSEGGIHALALTLEFGGKLASKGLGNCFTKRKVGFAVGASDGICIAHILFFDGNFTG